MKVGTSGGSTLRILVAGRDSTQRERQRVDQRLMPSQMLIALGEADDDMTVVGTEHTRQSDVVTSMPEHTSEEHPSSGRHHECRVEAGRIRASRSGTGVTISRSYATRMSKRPG